MPPLIESGVSIARSTSELDVIVHISVGKKFPIIISLKAIIYLLKYFENWGAIPIIVLLEVIGETN